MIETILISASVFIGLGVVALWVGPWIVRNVRYEIDHARRMRNFRTLRKEAKEKDEVDG